MLTTGLRLLSEIARQVLGPAIAESQVSVQSITVAGHTQKMAPKPDDILAVLLGFTKTILTAEWNAIKDYGFITAVYTCVLVRCRNHYRRRSSKEDCPFMVHPY